MSHILFPINPVIGRMYEVPHVFCNELGYAYNLWVPINSALHEDKNVIGFDPPHWHIDWRFVKPSVYKRVMQSCLKTTEIKQQVGLPVIFDTRGTNISPTKEIKYFTVKYYREYAHKDFEEQQPRLYNTWPKKLQAAYCGSELKLNDRGQYVCPHKGIVVDLNYTNEKGQIICPGHLLKFNKQLKAL